MNIQIQGLQVSSEEARDIVSYDTVSKEMRHYLIRVNFYPPLADIIFLFKDEESRDKAFKDAQQQEII